MCCSGWLSLSSLSQPFINRFVLHVGCLHLETGTGASLHAWTLLAVTTNSILAFTVAQIYQPRSHHACRVAKICDTNQYQHIPNYHQYTLLGTANLRVSSAMKYGIVFSNEIRRSTLCTAMRETHLIHIKCKDHDFLTRKDLNFKGSSDDLFLTACSVWNLGECEHSVWLFRLKVTVLLAKKGRDVSNSDEFAQFPSDPWDASLLFGCLREVSRLSPV